MKYILDTHVHFWSPGRVRYPWLDVGIRDGLHFVGRGRLPASFVPADFDAEWGGFGFKPFVHIEAGAHPEDSVAETEWLIKTQPPPRLVVHADLANPDLEVTLRQQLALSPSVVGVRQIISYSRDPARTFTPTEVMDDSVWSTGLGVLERLGLSFDLQIYPEQAALVVPLARAYGGLRFIVNHGLLPTFEEPTPWFEAVGTLAKLPNVAIKLGGYSMGNRDWTAPQANEFMQRTVAAFGPDRCMVGTNAPVESARNPPERFAFALKELFDGLDVQSADQISSSSAQRWYQLR